MNLLTKIRNYINRKVLKTPGVKFLQQNSDKNMRKKHINFWLNRARKKKNFQKYFFQEVNNQKNQITFKNESENYKLSQKMLDSLSNNGLLIIEDALPEFERNQIIEYFDELKNKNKFEKKWLKKPYNPNFYKEVSEMLGITSIKNFEFLNSYSKQLSKEIYGKIVEPTVELRYLKYDKDCEEEKVRGATYLHTDRFLPHVKVYYTPFEITMNTAPLEYVLSSHKINDDYLNFYYETKNFDETDRLFNKFKFEKKVVCVPKNSLYVAFTNGFHKRTQFKNNDERSLVFLQYVERFNKIDYLI